MIETNIQQDHATGDLLDVLVADHEEVTRVFSAFLGIALGNPERKRLIDHASELLVQHDEIEEACLYPFVRERTEGGSEVAPQALEQHAETDVLLRRIAPLDAKAPGFDRQVALLHELVTGHMRWEEARVFPMLREELDQRELDEMGDRARAMRRRAPHDPRPHPGVQAPADDFRPPELSTAGKLHYLFTPAGGWDRMRPH
jgi:hemerythrin superfamily protein